MTTAPIEYGISKDTVTPSMIVSSFLPAKLRGKAAPWIHRLPLIFLLAYQAGMSMRLKNTAYRDEGLYIWTGHRLIAKWFHGAPLYTDPHTYFSGSPYVYPPLAAGIDRFGQLTHVGGLTMVRTFSLLCMLIATMTIFSFSQRLFSRKVGTLAAAAFAFSGLTQHLGHYATFDAMSLMLLALALAVGVRAIRTHRMVYSPVIAGLLVLAVLTKYAALLFVPVVLAVIFLTASQRLFSQRIAVLSFVMFATTLTTLALTVARPSYRGFKVTTSQRLIIVPGTIWDIIHKTLFYEAGWLVAAVGGLVVLMRSQRRYWLPSVLFVGALAPMLYQAKIGEQVSLEKHLDFGLAFAAPLIGVALTTIGKVWQKVVVLALATFMLIQGAAIGKNITSQWSNSSALVSTLAYSFRDAPYIHTLGEPVEPVRYAFEDVTQQWQFDTTDPIVSLYYKPPTGAALRGLKAAKAGLAAGYWQLVYFDNSTVASRTLTPLMKGFGYTNTGTVRLTNAHGPDIYTIWQRWPKVSKAVKAPGG